LAKVLFGVEPGGSKARWVRGLTINGALGVARERGVLVPQHGAGLDYLWDWENIGIARPDGLGVPGPEARAHSGGEKRALLVERGLAAGRDLVWLDEPAAGLDIGRTRELAEKLRGLADDGVALIVTTHRVDLAHEIADQVVFLSPDGTVERIGSPDDASELDAWLTERLARAAPTATGLTAASQRFPIGIGPLTAFEALLSFAAIVTTHRVIARRSFGAAWSLILMRGALFHFVVGAITAAIIYVSIRTSGGVTSATRWIPMFGMEIVLRVTQPLAAILAGASSGAAVSSWLGGMVAREELEGLRALDVDIDKTIKAPVTLAVASSVLLHTLVFGAAMMATLGGVILVLSDAPGPTLNAFLGGASDWFIAGNVALWLPKLIAYPLLVAGITVGFATVPKPGTGAVGSALTRAIIRSTFAIVLLELLLLLPSVLP
jgi:ABC-type transporter Mla maintaining outer membrane lipid asymmetry permease subunit MlaE